MSIYSLPKTQDEQKNILTESASEQEEDYSFTIDGNLMVDTGANISTDKATASMTFQLGGTFFWHLHPDISPGFYVGARYHLVPERAHRVHRVGLTASPALMIHLARTTIIAEGGLRPQYNHTDAAFDLGGGGSINIVFSDWGVGVFAEQHDILMDRMRDGVSLGIRLFTHFILY